jgi:ATP dependent DNA ligase domain
MLQRTFPAGFIAPCLPTKTHKLPAGSQWLHEIKHDGFRVIARKDGARVKLYSRPGNDFTHHFPLIAESLARLRSHTCIIDREAVACDDNGRDGQKPDYVPWPEGRIGACDGRDKGGGSVAFILIRAGLATAKAERVVAGNRPIEVTRVRITEAGGGGHSRQTLPKFAERLYSQ